MAKQPDLHTIDDGWYETSDLNYNFYQITQAFENALWRTSRTGEGLPETPNFMDVDYDVADADVTNVNALYVNSMNVANNAFPGFGEQYVYKLGLLECDTAGAMISHDAVGDPECVAVGTNGQVLKVATNYPAWGEDTDTDTVGVTVQEDGVTVAENVTTINFLWPGDTLVTTPAGNQVDLEMSYLLAETLWEDTTDNDTNVSSAGNIGTRTRVGLVQEGISIPTTDDVLFFIAEASNYWTQSGGPAAGTWIMQIDFYDATGNVSTPGTGVFISPTTTGNEDLTSTTAGGSLLTAYAGIPAGTAYVDVLWDLRAVIPVGISADWSDRYRAIVNTNLVDSQAGISFPGGVNTQITFP